MRKEYDQFVSSPILEGMTSIRALIHARDRRVNDRPVLKIMYDEMRTDKLARDLSYLRAKSGEYGFTVEKSNEEEISALTIGNTHGGLIAICGERTVPNLTALSEIPDNGFYVMIEGIEDPYNFGYALRSLHACGVTGIILSERNWLTAAGVVARASAGASEALPAYISTPIDAIRIFGQSGYNTVAADLRTDNELGTTPLPLPLLLIVGGEKRGISRTVLDAVHTKIKIPYASDFHASLSAASAVTMFAYEIMRQNRK